MKTKLFIFFLFVKVYSSIACTPFPDSFCAWTSKRPNDHIICGVILSKSTHSISIGVMGVLRGIESRSVITVWDGKDLECNGKVPMGAGELGDIGDTIVALLPMIIVQDTVWDVIGDYHRPKLVYAKVTLKLSNDTVRGFVFGSPYSPTFKYAYSGFKLSLQNNAGQCVVLGVKENISNYAALKYEEGLITFITDSPNDIAASLYSVDGRLLTEIKLDTQKNLDYSNFPQGVYLLKVVRKDENLLVRKVMR